MKLLVAVLLLCTLAACTVGAEPIRVTPRSDVPATIAVVSQMAEPKGNPPQPGEAAPEFSYSMNDGSARSLSMLRGRKMILNFWATWCEPCRAEMPDLQRLADTHQADLVVLGINKDQELDQILSFLPEVPVRYTLIANPKGDISERYGIRSLPMTYFINSDGSVAHVRIGFMEYAEMEQLLAELR
jgi:thiol-disulfide isomerase/thioredoxin